MFVDYDNYDLDAYIAAQFDFEKIGVNASFSLNITEKSDISRNTTNIEVKCLQNAKFYSYQV